MAQSLAATGGFLLAVLWMDLMFDVQALGAAGVLAPEVVDSIAAYYHRVTTAADPMGNVVGLVMMLTLLGAMVQLARSVLPLWLRMGALLTAAFPTVYALAVIVPAAVRLGARQPSLALESELVRSILWGHVACFVSVALFVVLQILAVRRLQRGAAPGGGSV